MEAKQKKNIKHIEYEKWRAFREREKIKLVKNLKKNEEKIMKMEEKIMKNGKKYMKNKNY